jgi:hypothetical protein
LKLRSPPSACRDLLQWDGEELLLVAQGVVLWVDDVERGWLAICFRFVRPHLPAGIFPRGTGEGILRSASFRLALGVFSFGVRRSAFGVRCSVFFAWVQPAPRCGNVEQLPW